MANLIPFSEIVKLEFDSLNLNALVDAIVEVYYHKLANPLEIEIVDVDLISTVLVYDDYSTKAVVNKEGILYSGVKLEVLKYCVGQGEKIFECII
jgi:hypothetical protein